MDRPSANKLPLELFGGLGIAAVVAGGLVAAFSAARPSEYALWVSAYLVLVVGVLQVGLGIGLHRLVLRPTRWFTVSAFALYNLGNFGVVLGTGLKNSHPSADLTVDIGSLLLAISMIMMIYAVRSAKRSWLLVAFYAIAVIIFVSMPIGLVLAASR